MYVIDPQGECSVVAKPTGVRCTTGLGAAPNLLGPLDFITTAQPIQVSPTLLVGGLAFGLVAAYLLGEREGPKRMKRKREAAQKKIKKLQEDLRKLDPSE